MKNGFTIIEMVISIFILSTAIIGIYSAFSVASILTADSENRLIATYLAQEGIEIVRNIRDTNWLKIKNTGTGTWLDGLTSCAISDGACAADYTSTSMLPFGPAGFLKKDQNGFYTYNTVGTTDTQFKRKIIITPIADTIDNIKYPLHIIRVRVEVSWEKKPTLIDEQQYSAGNCVLGKNCNAVETTMYNWF